MGIVDVVLVYPYFNEELDRSIFRYPSLGLGYLASVAQAAGFSVQIVDCTFLTPKEAYQVIAAYHPRILGIYSMVTMNHHAVAMAKTFREQVELLLVGGPLPTASPASFIYDFDGVVLGEGEVTFREVLEAFRDGKEWRQIPGLAYAGGAQGSRMVLTAPRSHVKPLDNLPLPARDLFPNAKYQWYWNTFHGYTATSLLSTRGCPHLCDFCSNPVFGVSYRERGSESVLQELEEIKALGYDRAFFSDDCFTQNSRRVRRLCELILESGLDLEWMCLSRADRLSDDLAKLMRKAGCQQVFFGIESGNDRMLQVIGKRITTEQVRHTVTATQKAGIQTGGFFILGYPGDTTTSLLDTINYSSHLPLDYLSYSFPYPIFGTGLYKKVQSRITRADWQKQRFSATRHDLLFKGDFSATKLRFGMLKGLIQHKLNHPGSPLKTSVGSVFERVTNQIMQILR